MLHTPQPRSVNQRCSSTRTRHRTPKLLQRNCCQIDSWNEHKIRRKDNGSSHQGLRQTKHQEVDAMAFGQPLNLYAECLQRLCLLSPPDIPRRLFCELITSHHDSHVDWIDYVILRHNTDMVECDGMIRKGFRIDFVRYRDCGLF